MQKRREVAYPVHLAGGDGGDKGLLVYVLWYLGIVSKLTGAP
jgi:hypothetical protein